ncbi:hypothetical protein IQ07DRAFT_606437 [Pyrenochaeta sp. DS3sAY3a]|nr:hypothetical protein IQ07DRAFT_606437 [Pyrenochaeta sp. DS3sAY3a]
MIGPEPYTTNYQDSYQSDRPYSWSTPSSTDPSATTYTLTTFVTFTVTSSKDEYTSNDGYSLSTQDEGYPAQTPDEKYPALSPSYSNSYPAHPPSYDTSYQGGYHPAGPSGGYPAYSDDTLSTACPKQCNPFDPTANRCDITSSCTTTGKDKYYCACRAGFRPSAWDAKDLSKQFRLKSQPYVYTGEDVVCDTVCNDTSCSEVLEKPQCQ